MRQEADYEKQLIEKIIKKKEFSELPMDDIKRALGLFIRNEHISDEDKVKRTRDLLRKVYSGFGGRRLLVFKDKDVEEILKKHLSTRERFDYYEEIYSRLLKGLNSDKEITILDLGAGVNGFSYYFFEKIGFTKIKYTAVEAVGQLVNITNLFFTQKKLGSKASAVHLSLFDYASLEKIIKKSNKPRIIFMFKVIDSLEKIERDYTLVFLKKLKECGVERIVLSFPTKSWFKRKNFFAKRTWLIDFIQDNFEISDDFEVNGERYLVFS